VQSNLCRIQEEHDAVEEPFFTAVVKKGGRRDRMQWSCDERRRRRRNYFSLSSRKRYVRAMDGQRARFAEERESDGWSTDAFRGGNERGEIFFYYTEKIYRD
jgi:hypothetical protein